MEPPIEAYFHIKESRGRTPLELLALLLLALPLPLALQKLVELVTERSQKLARAKNYKTKLKS